MPKILIFGDVHGHLDTMIGAITPGTDFVLQVGDFGTYLSTGNLSALPPHRSEESYDGGTLNAVVTMSYLSSII